MCDCAGRRGFIESMRFSGDHDHGRHQVWICMQCGKIHVTGERNGQHFDVSFHLYMPEHLAVVGKFAKELEEKPIMYHPFPEDQIRATRRAQSWLNRDPLFLDTETTGMNRDDEICEIAIIDKAGEKLINTLVKPTKPIPGNASDIHGISNDIVQDAPTFLELLPELERVIKDRLIVIYNAEFDIGMINNSARAHGVEDQVRAWWLAREIAPGIMERNWNCAMKLYAEWYGDFNEYRHDYRWQRLGSAALQCGIELPLGIHRAYADAEITRRVLLHVAGYQLPDQHISTEEADHAEN